MRIYTTKEWGARRPRGAIQRTYHAPDEAIFHHTYSHVRQLDSNPTESLEEAFQFARDIQKSHMDSNGWIDTGNNFTITRGGHILEGRHGSIDAISAGLMVISAHCPGHNDKPGIEHEHRLEASMSVKQKESSIDLFTWICQCTGMRPTQYFPHSKYYATMCPAQLTDEIMVVRLETAKRLTAENVYKDEPSPMWRWIKWRDRGHLESERRMANFPLPVPWWWWTRYATHIGKGKV